VPEATFFMIVTPRDVVIADYAVRSYAKIKDVDFSLLVYSNYLLPEQKAYYFPRWEAFPFVDIARNPHHDADLSGINSRIQADALEWLDKLAPPSWHEPDGEVARALSPNPGDYRHHRGGEDNGDAHLKNLLVHHQVIVPITAGRLDLGPWQQIFYCEFDGGRRKRLVIKVIGE